MSELDKRNLEQVTGGDGGATGGWGEEPVFEKVKLGCPFCKSQDIYEGYTYRGMIKDFSYICRNCDATFLNPIKFI